MISLQLLCLRLRTVLAILIASVQIIIPIKLDKIFQVSTALKKLWKKKHLHVTKIKRLIAVIIIWTLWVSKVVIANYIMDEHYLIGAAHVSLLRQPSIILFYYVYDNNFIILHLSSVRISISQILHKMSSIFNEDYSFA